MFLGGFEYGKAGYGRSQQAPPVESFPSCMHPEEVERGVRVGR